MFCRRAGSIAGFMSCLLAVVSVFSGWKAVGGEDEANKRVLHLFTWTDYFDSEVINEFQKKYDCVVSVDIFDSNELMYQALRLDSSGYDVMTPSTYICRTLYQEGMLLELDHDKIPNLKNIQVDPDDLSDFGEMKYGVPYTRTIVGIGYDKTQVSPASLGSWDIFSTAEFSGRMAMLTDMRECMGVALKFLGCSLNSVDADEIREAGRVIRDWKRNLALFDVESSKDGLLSGDFVAVHAYNGDIAQAMVENPNLGFYVPAEGSSLAWDEFIISADSPEAELAHAFINHMLDPEMARRNMESIRYYMPNGPALELLSPDLLRSPAFSVPNDHLDRCEVIRALGADNEKYETVWREVMQP